MNTCPEGRNQIHHPEAPECVYQRESSGIDMECSPSSRVDAITPHSSQKDMWSKSTQVWFLVISSKYRSCDCVGPMVNRKIQ